MKVGVNARTYVVGDIHGRADLLQKIIQAIKKDVSQNPPTDCLFITLGDYIDRGPESRQVIETFLKTPLKGFQIRHLKGNHEDMLLTFLKDPLEGVNWLSNGGWATLISYGFSTDELPGTVEELKATRDKFLKKLPKPHLQFFRALKNYYQWKDYFFVHAGIRPKLPLTQQKIEDLMWIRDEFLNSTKDFGKIIVHGHSIVPKPEIHSNRIALDTGAFHTGKLTCLVINNAERYFFQAIEGVRSVKKIEGVNLC